MQGEHETSAEGVQGVELRFRRPARATTRAKEGSEGAAAISGRAKLRVAAFGQTGRICFPPNSASRGGAGPPLPSSEVSLLGQDQGVVHLDAEVADGALQLRVAEQELARTQIARALVDQRNLGPA